MSWFWLGGTQHGVATDDGKELLRQLRIVANRPDTDRDLTSDRGYLFLTQAQRAVFKELQSHCPALMVGVPEKLTTTDNGATYVTRDDASGHIEIYASPLSREMLIEGPYWADDCDYTREGMRTIRMQRARTFPDGPYARYVHQPGVIDDVQAPTMQPAEARSVLPWMAAGMWAATGNIDDPTGYFTMANRLLWGDSSIPGSVGLIPSYKLQYASTGQGGGVPDLWWRSPDLRR